MKQKRKRKFHKRRFFVNYKIDHNSTQMNNNPLIAFENIGDRTITTFHNCITALKEYESKSLEELRWEDYQLNKKYPKVLPPSLTNSSKANSSITTTTTTASYTPVYKGPTDHLPPMARNVYPPITSRPNTKDVKYKKTPGADFKPSWDGKSLVCQDTNHICITAMHEYENASFEELRYSDYRNNCKFGNGRGGDDVSASGSSTISIFSPTQANAAKSSTSNLFV